MLTYKEYVKKARRDYVATLIAAAAGNVSQAAKLAGINRTHLHALMVEARVRGQGQHTGVES